MKQIFPHDVLRWRARQDVTLDVNLLCRETAELLQQKANVETIELECRSAMVLTAQTSSMSPSCRAARADVGKHIAIEWLSILRVASKWSNCDCRICASSSVTFGWLSRSSVKATCPCAQYERPTRTVLFLQKPQPTKYV